MIQSNLETALMKEFLSWQVLHNAELNKITFLLGEQMSDEPQILIDQATRAESLYARIGMLLAECQSYLEESAASFLPDSGEKELDRKTKLTASLAPIRCLRDKMKAMLAQCEMRTSLAQSLLRHIQQLNEVKVMRRNPY